MLNWAITFLVLAVLAAAFGFSGAAGTLTWGAQILAVAFVILFIVSLIFGRRVPPTV